MKRRMETYREVKVGRDVKLVTSTCEYLIQQNPKVFRIIKEKVIPEKKRDRGKQ